jgi:hypothetical protein
MAEPLGVLLLPVKLEEFELSDHARGLLEVPRVVAVEPGRWRGRGWFGGEVRASRQARRLRFPGHPALLVLYHAAQYPLARALSAKHQAELWYVRWQPPGDPELELLDQLASDRAARIVSADAVAEIRQRLRELEVISHRPFVPGGRLARR